MARSRLCRLRLSRRVRRPATSLFILILNGIAPGAAASPLQICGTTKSISGASSRTAPLQVPPISPRRKRAAMSPAWRPSLAHQPLEFHAMEHIAGCEDSAAAGAHGLVDPRAGRSGIERDRAAGERGGLRTPVGREDDAVGRQRRVPCGVSTVAATTAPSFASISRMLLPVRMAVPQRRAKLPKRREGHDPVLVADHGRHAQPCFARGPDRGKGDMLGADHDDGLHVLRQRRPCAPRSAAAGPVVRMPASARSPGTARLPRLDSRIPVAMMTACGRSRRRPSAGPTSSASGPPRSESRVVRHAMRTSVLFEIAQQPLDESGAGVGPARIFQAEAGVMAEAGQSAGLIVAIDDQDAADALPRQRVRGRQAGGTGADDQHAWIGVVGHVRRRRRSSSRAWTRAPQ